MAKTDAPSRFADWTADNVTITPAPTATTADRGDNVPEGATDPGLYIGRPLLNSGELEHWWGEHRVMGDPDLDPNPHLTVAYSKDSFPWRCDSTHVTVAADRTSFGVLGPKNAVVLHLDSPLLQSRYEAAKAAGAVSDYDEYRPHITLFYLGSQASPDAVASWANGTRAVPAFPLVFGPEIKGPVDQDVFAASKGQEPRSLAADIFAAARDPLRVVVDRFANAMAASRINDAMRYNHDHDPKTGEFSSGEGEGAKGGDLETAKAKIAKFKTMGGSPAYTVEAKGESLILRPTGQLNVSLMSHGLPVAKGAEQKVDVMKAKVGDLKIALGEQFTVKSAGDHIVVSRDPSQAFIPHHNYSTAEIVKAAKGGKLAYGWQPTPGKPWKLTFQGGGLVKSFASHEDATAFFDKHGIEIGDGRSVRFNPNHAPAGIPSGGQFISGAGAGAAVTEAAKQTAGQALTETLSKAGASATPLQKAKIIIAQSPAFDVEAVKDAMGPGFREAVATQMAKAPDAAEYINARMADTMQRVGGSVSDYGNVINGTGIQASNGVIKSERRTVEKAVLDYDGDVSRVQDVARAAIAVDTKADVDKVYAALKADDRLIREKNRLTDEAAKQAAGYRDIMMTVKAPNGLAAEIQVHVRPMLQAKETKGHVIYEKLRRMGQDAKAEMLPLMHEMEQMYYHAWETVRSFLRLGDPYTYYEVDDRSYRSLRSSPLPMDRWSDVTKTWEPYAGDSAKVVWEGAIVDRSEHERKARRLALRDDLLRKVGIAPRFNAHHAPAGSAEGGQFSSAGQAADAAALMPPSAKGKAAPMTPVEMAQVTAFTLTPSVNERAISIAACMRDDIATCPTCPSGFTVTQSLMPTETPRFMASLGGNEATISPRNFTGRALATYAEAIKSASKPTDYIGGSFYDGVVHLDTSRGFGDFQSAVDFGHQHQQVAIFDCKGTTKSERYITIGKRENGSYVATPPSHIPMRFMSSMRFTPEQLAEGDAEQAKFEAQIGPTNAKVTSTLLHQKAADVAPDDDPRLDDTGAQSTIGT